VWSAAGELMDAGWTWTVCRRRIRSVPTDPVMAAEGPTKGSEKYLVDIRAD
jgi:hypothetical protein